MTDGEVVRRLNAVIGLQIAILGVLLLSALPPGYLPIYALAGALLSPILVLAVLNYQS